MSTLQINTSVDQTQSIANAENGQSKQHESDPLEKERLRPADVESQKQTASLGPPPDGGYQAWANVVGGWLILFSTFGYLNAFGVFQDYYQTYCMFFHSSCFEPLLMRCLDLPTTKPAVISVIGAFQLFLMFFLSPFMGRLMAAGWFHWQLAFGTIIYTFGLMMTSLSKEFYNIFLSQGIVMSMGVGMLFLPTISLLPQWFVKKRALATGIAISGSSVGGVIFVIPSVCYTLVQKPRLTSHGETVTPTVLNHLFYSSTGFGWTVRASAFLNLGCLIIANLIMRTRTPVVGWNLKRPQGPPIPKPNFSAIFTDVPYMLIISGNVLIMLGLFYIIFYIQIYAASVGVPDDLAFYTLAVLNAASIFGRTLPNYLADKLGALNMMIPCCFASCILQWIMLACKSTGSVMALSALYGFFSGAFVSLIPGCLGLYAKTPAEIAPRLGCGFMLQSFGALAGGPLVGAILGDGSNVQWWKASTWAGCTIATAVCLQIIARQITVKRLGRQRL